MPKEVYVLKYIQEIHTSSRGNTVITNMSTMITNTSTNKEIVGIFTDIYELKNYIDTHLLNFTPLEI